MNLNTLKFVVELIDVCSKRGAFQGDELQNVGTVRNAIAEWIEQVEAEHAKESGETDENETEETAN